MATEDYFNGGRSALAQLLSTVGVAVDSTTSSESSDDTSTDESEKGGLIHRDFIQELMSNIAKKRIIDSSSPSPPKRARRRRWRWKAKLPYTSSMFYRDYHNPKVRLTGTADAKEFRLNYRMPWSQAHKIVRKFVERGWVVSEAHPAHHMMTSWMCPPEIKILGTLYWLGEGCTFRTIHNLSGRTLSAYSFCKFAKKFCHKMAQSMIEESIKIPATVQELQRISAVYHRMGFPGACGSTDGVQIPWEGCPFAYRISFTGKEGYPTLGFNVTVAHDMQILHVVATFAGRFNDKTKILHDEYVDRLRSGFYDGFKYHMFDAHGERVECDVPYVICDNGYHRWLQLICPFKTTSKAHLALWSKLLESVRKDVERTFGVMKKRFRILKVPILFRDAAVVQDIFLTCCVLHNMLLKFDKQFDNGEFQFGVSEDTAPNTRRRILVNNVRRLLRAGDDFSYMGVSETLDTEVDTGFESFRKKLATHTYYCYMNKLILKE